MAVAVAAGMMESNQLLGVDDEQQEGSKGLAISSNFSSSVS